MIMSATEEQINYVKEVLSHGWTKTKEDFKGDYWTEFYGLLGQLVVGDWLRIERSIHKVDQFDLPWKGNKWDVKTRRGNAPCIKEYVHNVNGKQVNNNVDGYIGVCYQYLKNEKEIGEGHGPFDIRGYIGKKEFIKHAKFYPSTVKRERTDKTSFYPYGEYGMWEIKDKYLIEFVKEDRE
jgi:hypothetical protein